MLLTAYVVAALALASSPVAAKKPNLVFLLGDEVCRPFLPSWLRWQRRSPFRWLAAAGVHTTKPAAAPPPSVRGSLSTTIIPTHLLD